MNPTTQVTEMPHATFHRALSDLLRSGDLINEGTDRRPFYKAANEINLSTLSTPVHPSAESVRPPHSPLGVDRRVNMDKSEPVAPQVDGDQPDLDLVRPNPGRTHCGCGNELQTSAAIWSGKCKPCRGREEAA